MKVEYDIQELYRLFFGYTGLPFPGALNKYEPNYASAAFDKININKIENHRYQRNNILGKPYFMPVQIGSEWLPNDPMMSVMMQKRIISTPVTGRTGTVKELIGTDDYRIRIRGVAVNQNSDDFPENDINKLIRLAKKDFALEIKSLITELFDIKNIVIESLNLPENQNCQNVQPYELSLLSDDDFLASSEDALVTVPQTKQASRIYSF